MGNEMGEERSNGYKDGTDEQFLEEGASVQDAQAYLTIKPVPKPKKQKLIIAVLLLLMGLAIVYLGQFIASGMNPKMYFLKVLNNTDKSLKAELAVMKKNNPVLKRYDEISAGASRHQMTVDSEFIAGGLGFAGFPSFSLDFIMTNDPENKQLQVGTDFPLIGGAYLYFSEQETVVSFLGENYTLDAKMAGTEIRTFLDNNGISYEETAVPMDLDISYGAVSDMLTNYNTSGVLPSHSRTWDRYWMKLMELYEDAELKRASGEVRLGDKLVKCTVITLTLTEESIKEYLGSLYQMGKEDSELRDLLGEDYEYILEYAENYEGGDILGEFYIYKDNIIEANITTDEMRLKVAARGEEYRLDHIEASLLPKDEEEFSVIMRGNHIGGTSFSSEITSSQDAFIINWDPEIGTDNVSIQRVGGDNTVFTFALYEEGVIFKPFSGENSESLVIRAFPVQTGAINLPVMTTPLKDLNLQELVDRMNLFG